LDTLNAPVQRVVILLIIYGGAFAILGGLATVWLAYLGKDAPSNAPQKRQPIATSNSRTLLGPALAALMASILLGGYTAWLTQGNLQRIAESVDAQQENHAEQRHIEELNYLFKELETGQSGFASTGNAFFLDYFYSASKRLPALVEHIKSDFSKPDQQEFNWADFDNLSDQYAKITAKVIAVRQTSGAPLALDDALFTDGKRLLNKLRLQVDEMSNRLDMRIKQGAIHIRSQRELASQQQWFSSFTVSALFLLSVVIWLYERQRRIHVYRQLEITNSEVTILRQSRRLSNCEPLKAA
jgi:CHASE3 domain sensor protein